jgi:hypothetical protein
MRKVFMFLFLVLSAVYVFGEQVQIFPNPTLDGKRLDLCLVWGNQCGQAAADAFCKLQVFDAAASFIIAKAVGPTVVFTGRQICNDPRCDGFESITCTRSGSIPPWQKLHTLDLPHVFPNGEGTASPQLVTSKDVMDERIDVQAQYSLLRMLKTGDEDAADASAMVSAVKAQLLAGIYQQDQQKPALRAQKVGKGWWQLFDGQPDERLAFCWKEPAESAPMIVMRKGVKSSPGGLDPALRQAWKECGLPIAPSVTADPTLPPNDSTIPPQNPEPSLPKPSDTNQPAKEGECPQRLEGQQQIYVVVTAQHHAIPAALIQVLSDDPQMKTADLNGVAMFDITQPGEVTVIAQATNNFYESPPSWYDGKTQYFPTSRTLKVLPSCIHTLEIDLMASSPQTPQPPGAKSPDHSQPSNAGECEHPSGIEGFQQLYVVVTAQQHSMPYAQVQLFSDDAQAKTADQNGIAIFDTHTTGRVTVSAGAGKTFYENPPDWYDGKTQFFPTPRSITIRPSCIETLEIILTSGSVVPEEPEAESSSK